MNIYQQFFKFLGVGGICTALQYLVLIVLVSFFNIEPVVSSTIGYVSGAVANYFLNKIYTFKSKSSHRQAMPRFVIIALCGLLINAFVLSFVNSKMGIHYVFAQMVATIVTLMWNFSANRKWTYSDLNNL